MAAVAHHLYDSSSATKSCDHLVLPRQQRRTGPALQADRRWRASLLKRQVCFLFSVSVTLSIHSILPQDWDQMIFLTRLCEGLQHIENTKKEMRGKKDEPSRRHICVRCCLTCCSNLWEHLCLKHDGAFITSLLSVCGRRRISM